MELLLHFLHLAGLFTAFLAVSGIAVTVIAGAIEFLDWEA